jgi:PhnB protein
MSAFWMRMPGGNSTAEGVFVVSIKGGRPNNGQLAPHLIVSDGEAAIAFYQTVFDAKELYRSPMPAGVGLHAQLRMGGSTVLISSGGAAAHQAALGVRSPDALGGCCTILEIYVPDVDAVFERASRAGATVTLAPSDQFFGDRYGQLRDPFGHIWGVATVKEELTPNEIAQRMAASR